MRIVTAFVISNPFSPPILNFQSFVGINKCVSQPFPQQFSAFEERRDQIQPVSPATADSRTSSSFPPLVALLEADPSGSLRRDQLYLIGRHIIFIVL